MHCILACGRAAHALPEPAAETRKLVTFSSIGSRGARYGARARVFARNPPTHTMFLEPLCVIWDRLCPLHVCIFLVWLALWAQPGSDCQWPPLSAEHAAQARDVSRDTCSACHHACGLRPQEGNTSPNYIMWIERAGSVRTHSLLCTVYSRAFKPPHVRAASCPRN